MAKAQSKGISAGWLKNHQPEVPLGAPDTQRRRAPLGMGVAPSPFPGSSSRPSQLLGPLLSRSPSQFGL